MNDNDKQQSARLKALESNEKNKKRRKMTFKKFSRL